MVLSPPTPYAVLCPGFPCPSFPYILGTPSFIDYFSFVPKVWTLQPDQPRIINISYHSPVPGTVISLPPKSPLLTHSSALLLPRLYDCHYSTLHSNLPGPWFLISFLLPVTQGFLLPCLSTQRNSVISPPTTLGGFRPVHSAIPGCSGIPLGSKASKARAPPLGPF